MNLDIHNKEVMRDYFKAAEDLIFDLWAVPGNSLAYAGSLFEVERLRRDVKQKWADFRCKRLSAEEFHLAVEELIANIEHIIHLSEPMLEESDDPKPEV